VKLLGAFERPYYAVTTPFVNWLIRSGVRPNTITTVGTGFVIASAVAYGTGHLRTGGALLLFSGILDTLDGQVARGGAMTTRFGAFYDSTIDRVGDGATFIGLGAWMLYAPDVAYRNVGIILCMVAILSSLLVSYARARAEGLHIDCKVGIAQRAERVLGLGLATLLVGAGPRGLVLQALVAVLTLASVITVVQRFLYVRRVADAMDAADKAETQAAARAAGARRAPLDTLAKGQ